MNFTILELNELIYCVKIALKHGRAVNQQTTARLLKEMSEELDQRCKQLDKLMEAETSAVQRWG